MYLKYRHIKKRNYLPCDTINYKKHYKEMSITNAVMRRYFETFIYMVEYARSSEKQDENVAHDAVEVGLKILTHSYLYMYIE